jgi:hypothetical protein
MSVEEGIKEIVLRRVKHILIYSRKDFFLSVEPFLVLSRFILLPHSFFFS